MLVCMSFGVIALKHWSGLAASGMIKPSLGLSAFFVCQLELEGFVLTDIMPTATVKQTVR